jgi:hypothetical protein
MFEMFLEGEFDLGAQASPEAIWSHLTPGMIEVSGEREKKHWDGAICVHIGFETPLAPGAFPYIRVLNGQFAEAGVET